MCSYQGLKGLIDTIYLVNIINYLSMNMKDSLPGSNRLNHHKDKSELFSSNTLHLYSNPSFMQTEFLRKLSIKVMYGAGN